MEWKIEKIIQIEKQLYWPVFSRKSVCFVRGEGPWLYDVEGRKYLDFVSGVGVVPLGHAHPEVTEVAKDQVDKLTSVSNLYYSLPQLELAESLQKSIGLEGRWFFSNSGTEAMEAAIKIARRYGILSGKKKILSLKNSFHGRTFGSMSATAQEKIQKGYGDLLPYFDYVEPGSFEELLEKFDESVSAIIVETVQGEGGVKPVSESFLRKAKELCDEYGALFIVDEVQTGLGRTGMGFISISGLGIAPDVFALAKGLANGIPIGATWIKEELSGILNPGDHGGTYGGNAFACAVAKKVVEIIERDSLDEKNLINGNYFMQKIRNICENNNIESEVRAAGLMIGVEFKDIDVNNAIDRLMEKGLLGTRAGENTLRFLPPFIAEKDHFDIALEIFERTLVELKGA